jgi:hypothetical protein
MRPGSAPPAGEADNDPGDIPAAGPADWSGVADSARAGAPATGTGPSRRARDPAGTTDAARSAVSRTADLRSVVGVNHPPDGARANSTAANHTGDQLISLQGGS